MKVRGSERTTGWVARGGGRRNRGFVGHNNNHRSRGLGRGGGGGLQGRGGTQSLNNMLDGYHNIVGEEEVGGGRDEDLTDIGGRNTATAGVSGATSCVPNDFMYGRLETESSGGMTCAPPQAPPLYFDR